MTYYLRHNTPFRNLSALSMRNSGETVHHFLNSKKDRHAYISKNYTDKVDLSLVDNISHISSVTVGASFEKLPQHCHRNTILALDPQHRQVLLHFYTFVEPDPVSKWKIYDIICEWL